jgi:hypothetical protein
MRWSSRFKSLPCGPQEWYFLRVVLLLLLLLGLLVAVFMFITITEAALSSSFSVVVDNNFSNRITNKLKMQLLTMRTLAIRSRSPRRLKLYMTYSSKRNYLSFVLANSCKRTKRQQAFLSFTHSLSGSCGCSLYFGLLLGGDICIFDVLKSPVCSTACPIGPPPETRSAKGSMIDDHQDHVSVQKTRREYALNFFLKIDLDFEIIGNDRFSKRQDVGGRGEGTRHKREGALLVAVICCLLWCAVLLFEGCFS